MKEKNKPIVPLFTNTNSSFDLNSFLHGKDFIKTDTLGSALDYYRTCVGVSYTKLSKMTGISKTQLSYYFNDERTCNMNVLIALCIVLRVHPLRIDYLFSLTHYKLRETDPRYAILKSFLYGCAWNEELTLERCSAILKSKHLEALLPEKLGVSE